MRGSGASSSRSSARAGGIGPQPREARERQHDAIQMPRRAARLVQPAQPRVDVAAQFAPAARAAAPVRGALRQRARRKSGTKAGAARRGAADRAAPRRRRAARARRRQTSRCRAASRARGTAASMQRAGALEAQVLIRMHREIDLAREQRGVDLGGEEFLALDRRQRRDRGCDRRGSRCRPARPRDPGGAVRAGAPRRALCARASAERRVPSFSARGAMAQSSIVERRRDLPSCAGCEAVRAERAQQRPFPDRRGARARTAAAAARTAPAACRTELPRLTSSGSSFHGAAPSAPSPR